MPARHRSRQRALQVLFQADLRQQDAWDAIEQYYDTLGSEEPGERTERDPFMETLSTGTQKRTAEIDAMITERSKNWRLDRMPAVDRNILRMALYEMIYGGTPAPVVIDEALELARQFSTNESVSFINGVLDAIHRSRTAPDTPAG